MKINKTKEAFENCLFTLLQNKNYHDITINEICDITSKTKMTFYHYYKDKEDLLAVASVNLINKEYVEGYARIVNKETDLEEIEYQSLVITYEMIAKHYNQIRNLVYRGDTFPLGIFKKALFDNYSKAYSEYNLKNGLNYPVDYLSVFCFDGLYGSCLYYAEQLRSGNNKKKVKEDCRKLCRLLAKMVMSIFKIN